jgi:hypothetical protein
MRTLSSTTALDRLQLKVWLLIAAPIIAASTGCMSAITSATWRDALLDTVESIAEARAHDSGRRVADGSGSPAVDEPADLADDLAAPALPATKRMSLDEAVERAVERLSAVGQLDADTQATLLSMLESTSPEDWPAAIDAFAASLEANRPQRPALAARKQSDTVATQARPAQPEMEPLSFPEPPVVTAATVPEQPEPKQPEPAKVAIVEAARPIIAPQPQPEVIEPMTTTAPDVVEQPLPETPAPRGLTVNNACFVSRVRAWGVVDRFPAQVFQRGQEVIVYFEVDQLSARESPAGHSTSIDAHFRLVASNGRQVGQWGFEPVEETCHAPRRDYFARYFIRIPDDVPSGACRLEFVVTDLLAGVSTQAHLDLEVK